MTKYFQGSKTARLPSTSRRRTAALRSKKSCAVLVLVTPKGLRVDWFPVLFWWFWFKTMFQELGTHRVAAGTLTVDHLQLGTAFCALPSCGHVGMLATSSHSPVVVFLLAHGRVPTTLLFFMTVIGVCSHTLLLMCSNLALSIPFSWQLVKESLPQRYETSIGFQLSGK